MLAYGELLDLNCLLKFILMIILPFIGLFLWLENKVCNNDEAINHFSKGKEIVHINDQMNSLFEQDEEEDCAYCSFCGKLIRELIISRCSTCKTASYCSNACQVMHWRFGHKSECTEAEDHGEPYKYFEEKRNEGSVYYIEGEEEENKIKKRVNKSHREDGCAVCGSPSSKTCSRCKSIKYCSQTCQHFDWRCGHKFQCSVEKAKSTEVAMVNQQRLPLGNNNVVKPTNSYEVEDNAHSYGYAPLCLEFYSEAEENSNPKALVLSSVSEEKATNKGQKEVEEQLRCLKEELAKMKNEKITLQSERDNWEMRAKYSTDTLYSFRKENEHQLFLLKHENELISNSEKQARQMVHSLSERLHCLQIAVETGVAERKKQEEYIHILQNECAKAKTELQRQNKCVEETKLKLSNASNVVAAYEVSQPISLSRNPTFTRQGCAICLTNEKDMTFGCGHMSCRECGSKIRKCHICRKKITTRIRLFPD